MIDFPYLDAIKWLLFLLSIVLFIGWVLNSDKDLMVFKLSANPIVRKFYINSQQIIIQTFTFYFAFYLIFMLDRKSVLFNYLILFLYGIFVGYRIACKANSYLNDKK